jgi:hypothetical protein
MGELNLDNIDKALLQEYERSLDGYCPKQATKEEEHIQLGRKATARILRELTAPEKNYASTHKH